MSAVGAERGRPQQPPAGLGRGPVPTGALRAESPAAREQWRRFACSLYFRLGKPTVEGYPAEEVWYRLTGVHEPDDVFLYALLAACLHRSAHGPAAPVAAGRGPSGPPSRRPCAAVDAGPGGPAAARRRLSRPKPPAEPAATEPPDPDDFADVAQFLAGLKALMKFSRRSYRTLEEASKQDPADGSRVEWLPRATVYDMLAGKSLPSPERLQRFTECCGLDAGRQDLWEQARARIKDGSAGTPRRRRRLPAEPPDEPPAR